MAETIRIENVSFRYHGRTEKALKDITLSTSEREILLIAGRSGSGKSSLLRVINGLIPHFYSGEYHGRVYFYGEEITDSSARERFGLGISTVLQFPEDQILARTVWRAVAFGLANFGFPREEILRRVKWALKLVRMEKYFDLETAKLSTGQKQKVALASALAIRPRVLLLDEPTSQLDPMSDRSFLMTLKEIQDELDLTVIMSEHRIDEVISFIDHVIILNNGKIATNGSPREVFYSDIPRIAGIGYPKTVLLAKELSLEKKIITHNEAIYALKNYINLRDLRQYYEEKEFRKFGNPLLIVQDVWFKYNRNWVLKNISFQAYSGQFIAIMGPNGAGKTTLAKLLIGKLRPQKGKIIVNGIDLSAQNFKKLVGYVAYAPQNPEDLIFNSTVYDEIAFPLWIQGLKGEDINKTVYQVARKFGIEDILFKSPFSLSGGEKLRTVLASLYIMKPRIFILDEPTRGLDWELKIALTRELYRMSREGKLVIMITHDVELMAETPVDRILVLKDGEIFLSGDKREVLSSPKIEEANLLRPKVSEIFSSIGLEGLITLEEAVRFLKGIENVHG